MYEAVVYFRGPKTLFGERVVEDEIVARIPARWHWLARMNAQSLVARLIPGRCGWAVLKDGEVIEQSDGHYAVSVLPITIVGQSMSTAERIAATKLIDRMRAEEEAESNPLLSPIMFGNSKDRARIMKLLRQRG